MRRSWLAGTKPIFIFSSPTVTHFVPLASFLSDFSSTSFLPTMPPSPPNKCQKLVIRGIKKGPVSPENTKDEKVDKEDYDEWLKKEPGKEQKPPLIIDLEDEGVDQEGEWSLKSLRQTLKFDATAAQLALNNSVRVESLLAHAFQQIASLSSWRWPNSESQRTRYICMCLYRCISRWYASTKCKRWRRIPNCRYRLSVLPNTSTNPRRLRLQHLGTRTISLRDTENERWNEKSEE